MQANPDPKGQKEDKFWLWYFALAGVLFVVVFFFVPGRLSEVVEERASAIFSVIEEKKSPRYPPLDKAEYAQRVFALAHRSVGEKVLTPEAPNLPAEAQKFLWPKEEIIYPKDGAILPFNRVVAYYGNLYSTKMGVLGEYPKTQMLSMLEAEVAKWNEADPETQAIPALHYIVSVAQNTAGKDGKYRFVMPESEIEKVLAMAEEIDALVFLDIQVGLSDIYTELPKFEKYLKIERIHLGIDPEFYMKTGARPGKVIGVIDAKDINFAISYLSKIVKENDLPPKILVIHRFTQKMVTKYFEILPTPEVQVVMNMDGWGGQAHKLNTYKQYIYREPVQFTGFKLFYKNDTKEPNSTLLTPEQLLKLNPKPIYIQYQ